MDLCAGCQEFQRCLFSSHPLLQHGQRSNFDIDIHQTLSELSECADAFCDLCKYFRRELCYHMREEQRYYLFDVEDLKSSKRKVTLALWFSTDRPPGVGAELKISGIHAKTIDVQVGNFVASGLRNRDFDELLALGREWLKECIAKHTICDSHFNHTSGFLPTRLLDVGRQGEQSIRLVLSKHLLERSKTVGYTTLSYCWGNGPHTVSTTDENMAQRLNTIPIRLLPKTIQDAVYITRALKIRYLWVDALCIIQDNQADWEKEVPTMGKIYNHSLLTIAASGAKDSSGGCYCKRDAAQLPVFDFMLTKTNTRIEHDPQDFITLKATLPHWTNAVDRSALAKRGWALQEHSLSRRILFWTEDGLFWACAEQVASEYQPDLVWSSRERGLLDELIRGINSTHRHGHVRGSERYDNQERFWSDILELFTGLALTVSTDRLPAIVGLGTELARLTGKAFEMSAGVWRHNLVQELAWLTNTERRGKPSRSPDIPSWSWASVHQEVHFPAKLTDEDYVELAKVLSVESPKLRVRSRMANFRKTTSAINKFIRGPVQDGHSTLYTSAVQGPCVIELCRGTGDQKVMGTAVLDIPADVERTAMEPVPCVQWVKWTGATGWLVLAPISKKRKLYRRIGWLEFNDSDVSDDEEKTITLI